MMPFFSLPSFSRVCGKVKEISEGSARDGFGFNDVKGLQRTLKRGNKGKLYNQYELIFLVLIRWM